jgi:Kef-type K+ transport system membrane component KefB
LSRALALAAGKESDVPDVSFGNLVVICAVAVVCPLVLGLNPRLRVPSVVLEIVAGVVLGPSVLDWVHVDLVVAVLSVLGLGFLLFLAGLEIDLQRLRGRVLLVAVAGYLLTLALAVPLGLVFHAAGWVGSALLVAVAMSATSLGLVVPVLKDAGSADSETGRTVIAASTVADFAAVIALSLLFSATGGTGSTVVLLGAVGLLALAVAAGAMRAGRSMRLTATLFRLQDTTAEIRVRLTVLLFVAFVALASRFGLETILGAFLAGAVVSAIDRDTATHPHLHTKLDAIGYGFLIPVFFIASGLRLDLRGLLDHPGALARVPVFLAALLIVRGVPALLYRRQLGTRATAAAALLQATSLPFLVAATQIGVGIGLVSTVTATALVCAGLLSVLLFPAAALSLLRGGTATTPARPLTPETQR